MLHKTIVRPLLNMKEFWNERYQEEGWAYGSEPNEFVKQELLSLKDTSNVNVLFPAEGEGRNAVFAATLGFHVSAFDISNSGQQKALSLAAKSEVGIDYRVAGFDSVDFSEGTFDVVVFCYTHFPRAIQQTFISKMLAFLKPNGKIIFECFSENNIPYREKNPQVGGPDNIDMLYSIESVNELFSSCNTINAAEVITTLNEGKYHVGEACVIRMTGRK